MLGASTALASLCCWLVCSTLSLTVWLYCLLIQFGCTYYLLEEPVRRAREALPKSLPCLLPSAHGKSSSYNMCIQYCRQIVHYVAKCNIE